MSTKICLLVFACLIAFTVQQITIYSDLSKPQKLEHRWERCWGSGHALLALRADYREHLARAVKDLGLQRVRFHGLFDDDMSVYLPWQGQTYSWFNVDSIFDYFLSLGVRPLVELSFMPEALSSGDSYVFHYKGNNNPPKNWNDWSDLVTAFAKHIIDRYGIDEVKDWYFETWNEPNCGFWNATRDQYFQLLKVTSAALKSVDTRLKVGGPATCQSDWLVETLNFVQKNNVALDFVSTHEYPTDVTPLDRDIMKKIFTRSRQQVGNNMPLFYTEYNDGLYDQTITPSHDSSIAAAFAIKTVNDVNDIVDIYSWWTFTDIFEEGGQYSTPFQGGFGQMTIHGIPKPAWRAFELLHRTGYTKYPIYGIPSNSTVGTIVTSNHTHSMVIVYNYNVPQPGFDIKNELVYVTLTGLNANSPRQPYIERIDDQHANPRQAWIDLGSPLYPTRSQLDKIMRESELVKKPISDKIIDSTTIQFTLTMPPQSVAAITFEL
jgi:xylan 1,4-beta-xylosidase